MAKLTKAQRAVLSRLSVGPYYPEGGHIISVRSLVDRGLAAFHRPTLRFAITPAGRQALTPTEGVVRDE